jgi:dissimilatory sulfite reductase (desulfoviridin) alpha/beta subunit
MNIKEISDLKLEGYLKQKQGEYFSVRILSRAGNMNSEQLDNISKVAKKYGKGYIGFTTRLCIEIPWIKFDNIVTVKAELKKYNLRTGGTGKRVRPLVACKGTVCIHGLVDTQDICGKLQDKFFAVELPSKLKIGIVGCPNNCAKANLNDIGFMGQRVPKYHENKCVGCGLCISGCKSEAITKLENKIKLDSNKCLGCGECIKVCPKEAITCEKEGVSAFLGGKFGRKYRLGNKIEKIFNVEDIEKITDAILKYYKNNGKSGERFSNTIERIGWEKVESEIFDSI